jgi:hypothetical protein
VDGAALTLAPVVKILGVLLDQDLRFESHIGKAASKGMKAVLALRHLRVLPPSVARQLFISTVASKIDYAALVWCPARKDTVIPPGIGRLFEPLADHGSSNNRSNTNYGSRDWQRLGLTRPTYDYVPGT